MSNDGTAYNIRPRSTDQLVSAQFVRENFLFGVNLKDDDGNEMPDSLINLYIKSATRFIQRKLGGVLLFPTAVENEAHDYYFTDYTQFGHVKLHHYPVKKVTRYSVQFPLTSEVISFDPAWFVTDSVGAQVNLIPRQGTLSSILMGQGGQFIPILHTARDYLPYVIFVDYECGFDQNEVDEDILEIIGMKAAMGPLNIAGDLIAGAGIASKSIGIDGLSQSIGTTSSATNSGYGARILQYQKHIDSMISDIRNNLTGIQMVVA